MADATVNKSIKVRYLQQEDLAAVTEIDDKVTGQARRELWAKRFDAYEGIRPPWACLIAEYNGRVAGFVFGWVSGWEFGIPGEVGWIDIIGVDPGFRHLGIGQALVERFIEEASERRGISKLFTLVDPGDAAINGFFRSLGFGAGKMRQLERTVTS